MGSSAYGQLGSRTADGKVPTRVGGKIAGRFVEDIACGSHHVAVVTSKKEVYTWGKGTNGQLGHGNTDDRDTPTVVEFLKDKQVKSVVCGNNFTAVLSLHKWVPSADQSMCSGCRNPFGFIRKRHSCYNCGLIFCKSCTVRKSLKASLAPIMNKPYRVCDDCFAKLKKSGESVSSPLPPKARNGNIPRKFDENMDKEVLALRSHAQLSRLSSLGSSSQAESRLSRSELKLDFENRTIFPAQIGNFHPGGFNTPRLPIDPVGDSRKSLPPISRRTSRATSPASGKSSNRSSTVEALTCKSRHLEAELEKTSRRLKEVTARAETEAGKYKSAEEVIMSLTAKRTPLTFLLSDIDLQLEQVTDTLPPGQKGLLYNACSVAKRTTDIEHVFANATGTMCVPSEVNFNANNVSTSNGTKGQTKRAEIMIQDEAGVYLTLSPLPNGSNVLSRVRFSRKHFSEENAEKWWAANGAKLFERHDIIRGH
ncbi:pentatricopeptide repeat-containing protein [Hibiscus syriacus]|uniref:Pentatricopeptide repeat-containing protein n=1 Tax=Hibiscus syriacus TaxID=106335 RepID=A0A6A2YGH7_HIBSY|nr:pentatricopeptide repeat-containing protein [Hibiscus syriacus]